MGDIVKIGILVVSPLHTCHRHVAAFVHTRPVAHGQQTMASRLSLINQIQGKFSTQHSTARNGTKHSPRPQKATASTPRQRWRRRRGRGGKPSAFVYCRKGMGMGFLSLPPSLLPPLPRQETQYIKSRINSSRQTNYLTLFTSFNVLFCTLIYPNADHRTEHARTPPKNPFS